MNIHCRYQTVLAHQGSRVQEALNDVPLAGACLSLIFVLGVTDALGVNCTDHEQGQDC